MKLYRNAVILLVIAGLLVGAFVIVKNKKNGTDTAGNDDTIKIFDLDADKMVELTIENSDGKFVFTRDTIKEESTEEGKKESTEKKVWKISSPQDLKIDRDKIDSSATTFSRLTADKIIEDNAESLEKYGLSQPVLFSVKMDDGTVKTLEIGDKTPTESGYYVKEKGSSKVYTIGSYYGDQLKLSRNDMRDRLLFGGNTENITAVSLERRGQKVFSAKRAGKYDWAMTYPISTNASDAGISPILTGITQVNVANYIEEDAADLEKYGLAKPPYVIEFESSSGSEKLILGNEKEKGVEMYAKLGDSDEVFTVSPSDLNFLDKPLNELVDVFAYIVNIDQVDKITVEMDGYTLNCELKTDSENKDNDKFYVNGKDVTGLEDDKGSEIFRNYYQDLIGITFSEVEIDAKPSGSPEITFTYYLKEDPGKMKVEFIPKDDRYYYVVRNGQYAGILVEKKKFDEPDGLRDTYKKLMEAMNKIEG